MADERASDSIYQDTVSATVFLPGPRPVPVEVPPERDDGIRSPELTPGDLLGGYQLLYPIARGGMGQIWAGWRRGHHGLGSIVAIKTSLVDDSQDDLQALFFDEARIAVSIDHPNVCRTDEFGEDRGVHFLAMEWIDGASLWELFKALPPPHVLEPSLAAYVIGRACAGLHAAHELTDDDGLPLNVVHRDATPHNILVSRNGDVKVVDFGIVKSRGQLHATVTGEFRGKLNYIAPEQVRCTGVDRRTDVFALGCVLYVLTTGRRPFEEKNAGGTMLNILHGNYAKPSSLIPDYPAELEAIVERALETDPDRRFQSTELMRQALDAFVASRGLRIRREDLATLLLHHMGDVLERRRQRIRTAQKQFGVEPTGDIGALRSRSVSDKTAVEAASNSCTESVGTGTPLAMAAANRMNDSFGRLAQGGLALAIVLAVLFTIRGTRSVESSNAAGIATPAWSTPAISSPTPAVSTSKEEELVQVRVRTRPTSAWIQLDSGPPVRSPHTFEVLRDGAEHVIVVGAKSHQPARHVLRFDRDQSFDVVLTALEPTRARGPRERLGRRGRGTTKPTRPASLARPGIDETDPFETNR